MLLPYLKAGIKNERLKLVVDAVAAATWWTSLNIKDSPEIELQTPGSKWLVVKIGGKITHRKFGLNMPEVE
ncbi:hypothetical protein DPMN_118747 [Dreissena polymorpha]|uniref:Uncharacterized protein n=1 Tax=Dreissena polymorpha TaxID=45954 RepID=A0A9D4GLA3_DREPO|nr:hypothetical protein DPMN_118747 [Dreissena polymorpha]